MQSFPARPIRIGTRGSPLALWQARMVAGALAHRNGLGDGAVEIVTIRTTGDAVQDRPLSEIGGKGLFTKEIEAALDDGRIDLAVHSLKDVETRLPDGLEIAAVMEREDPRDMLISRTGVASICELPPGAVLGTASLRRGAFVRALRPDIRVVPLRGNVGTRLAKVEDGELDATLLAMAGLSRLGIAPAGGVPVPIGDILPAIAQGAIGIEIRSRDDATRDLVARLEHAPTRQAVEAERALLAALDGSCRTPIAGLAVIEDSGLHLQAAIAKVDGSKVHRAASGGAPDAARSLGEAVAARLLALGGPDFLTS